MHASAHDAIYTALDLVVREVGALLGQSFANLSSDFPEGRGCIIICADLDDLIQLGFLSYFSRLALL